MHREKGGEDSRLAGGLDRLSSGARDYERPELAHIRRGNPERTTTRPGFVARTIECAMRTKLSGTPAEDADGSRSAASCGPVRAAWNVSRPGEAGYERQPDSSPVAA